MSEKDKQEIRRLKREVKIASKAPKTPSKGKTVKINMNTLAKKVTLLDKGIEVSIAQVKEIMHDLFKELQAYDDETIVYNVRRIE